MYSCSLFYHWCSYCHTSNILGAQCLRLLLRGTLPSCKWTSYFDNNVISLVIKDKACYYQVDLRGMFFKGSCRIHKNTVNFERCLAYTLAVKFTYKSKYISCVNRHHSLGSYLQHISCVLYKILLNKTSEP